MAFPTRSAMVHRQCSGRCGVGSCHFRALQSRLVGSCVEVVAGSSRTSVCLSEEGREEARDQGERREGIGGPRGQSLFWAF